MRKLIFCLSIILILLVACSKINKNEKVDLAATSDISTKQLLTQAYVAKPIGSKTDLNPASNQTTENVMELIPIETAASSDQTEKTKGAKEINRFEIKHQANGKSYWVSISQDNDGRFELSVFDNDLVELQSIHIFHYTNVGVVDLNSDGYSDIVLGTNQKSDVQLQFQEAYLWNATKQMYDRVVFDNVTALVDFKIADGYIWSYPRYAPDYLYKLQKLVLEDNNLKKIKEYDEVQYTEANIKSNYWVTITQGEKNVFMLTLLDNKFQVLQSTPVDHLNIEVPDINLEDLNGDGYTDVVITLGGIFNEANAAFLYNPSPQGYIKVIYQGFDTLSWYSVENGYIENFIRGQTPDDGIMQKLVFDGNILKKVDE